MKRSALPFVRGVYGRVRRCAEPVARDDGPEVATAIVAPVVREEAPHADAARAIEGERPSRKPAVVGPVSSASVSAYGTRVQSSIATCRYSQPMPRIRRGAIAVDAVPDAPDLPELLHVEVQAARGKLPVIGSTGTLADAAAATWRVLHRTL